MRPGWRNLGKGVYKFIMGNFNSLLMKQIILFLLVLLSITSFINPDDGVSVIFENNTGKDFRSLKVNIAGREFIFPALKTGQQTPVVHVPRSYKFCFAQAITNTDTLLCQPCYVGETAYSNGKIFMSIFSFSEKGLEKNIGISGTWDANRFISLKKYINQ